MTYETNLVTIYENALPEVPKQSQKLFQQFINKIAPDYFVNEKNIDKLQKFADDKNIVEMIIKCLQPYRWEYSEHYDTLRIWKSWAVLVLSGENSAIEYFKSFVEYEKQNKAIHLWWLYWLFGLFPNSTALISLKNVIHCYYDEISPSLPAYQWAESIGLTLPKEYNWSISFNLITKESWYETDLTDKEREKLLRLSVRITSPQTYNSTFHIEINNKKGNLTGWCSDKEKGWFFENDTRIDFKSVLLHLKEFVKMLEQRYSVCFIKDKPDYLGMSKGIDKKIVKNWIANL